MKMSVNDFWTCILGDQGIAWIHELRTTLLTTFIGKNPTYKRKNLDSEIIDIMKCKTGKTKLLAVEYAISIRYYYQPAKARA